MAHAIQQPQFVHSPVKFKTFSKYDFVEGFLAVEKDEKVNEGEKKKIQAAMIADAIEETQAVLLENLATKDDLKKDIEQLKSDLTIRLTVIMTGLFTLLPLITDFIRHLFKF